MKLKLSSPLKVFNITQSFGNKNPKLYGSMGHNGIDFQAKHGTPIYATHNGYASYQIDGKGGHGVVIITDKEYEYIDDKCYFKTIYWHLPDPLKEPKLKSPFADKTGFTPVKTGDIIGYVDNTGNSIGDHLHFGLKPVLKNEAWGSYYNVEQINGYFGAIDPTPYFDLPQYILRGISRYGMKDDNVKILQALLMAHGHKIEITGEFNQKTTNTVRLFQKKNGLEIDGIVGKNTWQKLYTF